VELRGPFDRRLPPASYSTVEHTHPKRGLMLLDRRSSVEQQGVYDHVIPVIDGVLPDSPASVGLKPSLRVVSRWGLRLSSFVAGK
jgi:hypothetical protein